jgi:hypothetical protein
LFKTDKDENVVSASLIAESSSEENDGDDIDTDEPEIEPLESN